MAMCNALYHGHESYESKVKYIIDDLGKHADDFDGIVASGMSGLLIAAPVSLALGKTLGVVRHTDEKRHPGDHAGLHLIEKACFLDDFISGGRTFKQCYSALKAARDPNNISQGDLDYYIGQYGEAWVKEHHPEWVEAGQPKEHNIVAVYTYDRAYATGEKASNYYHVTSAVALQYNGSYRLWPKEVFDELRKGEKPKKQPVKQVPVRDDAGRFAPKPAPIVHKKAPAPPSVRARQYAKRTMKLSRGF